jgi:hypothetical protein
MSQGKNRALTVYKNPNFGVMPGEVLLAQRHFEKEEPEPVAKDTQTASYNVPVDLLNLSTPNVNHDDIQSISAVYKYRTSGNT